MEIKWLLTPFPPPPPQKNLFSSYTGTRKSTLCFDRVYVSYSAFGLWKSWKWLINLGFLPSGQVGKEMAAEILPHLSRVLERLVKGGSTQHMDVDQVLNLNLWRFWPYFVCWSNKTMHVQMNMLGVAWVLCVVLNIWLYDFMSIPGCFLGYLIHDFMPISIFTSNFSVNKFQCSLLDGLEYFLGCWTHCIGRCPFGANAHNFMLGFPWLQD